MTESLYVQNSAEVLLKSQQSIRLINSIGDNRVEHISAVVALIISKITPLPASSVCDLKNYYDTMCEIQNKGLVSDINEIVLIDKELILELIYKFFQFRYTQVYPNVDIFYLSPDSVITDFFGISGFVGNDILQILINKYKSINVIYSAYLELIKSLRPDLFILNDTLDN